MSSFQTVLDSQRSLLTFEDQLTTSRAKVALNRVALYKALGGGWKAAQCGMTLLPSEPSPDDSDAVEAVPLTPIATPQNVAEVVPLPPVLPTSPSPVK